MTNESPAEIQFSAKHHALLFAWISRAVIKHCGEERGAQVVRAGVQRYGEERGRRMALRAQANGHALSMANYLAYGEWQGEPGETEQEIVERIPDARVRVHQCPWHSAWEEAELMPYGRVYCQVVDEALVKGFNPGLKLDVESTRSNDDQPCEFVFHNANLNLPNLLGLSFKKKVRPGKSALMPWEYHLGHLYSTMHAVLVEQLGETGEAAMREALGEFAVHYGEPAAQVVKSYQSTDFSRLPE